MKLIDWSHEILDNPSRFFEPFCRVRKSIVKGNQLFMSQPPFNKKLIQLTKHLCFFICICSFLPGCQDEVNPDPIEELFFETTDSSFLYSDYDFVMGSELQMQFLDRFDNNENNWSQVDDGDYLVDISNGKLKMESKRDFLYYLRLDFIDFSATNFQLEIDFQFYGPSAQEFCALRWGGLNTWDNNYGFQVGKEGYFQIKHKNDDEWLDDIIGRTFLDDIINSNPNKLTIRRVSGVHYFFINETFVGKANDIVFKGNEFGPSVGSYSRCEFDNLKVGFFN